MHMQAPTLTTTRRPPLAVIAFALAIAATVALIIALATNDNTSSTTAPVQSSAGQQRVLDGSPLLRAAAAAPAVTITTQSGVARVWDGTPALRTSTVAHPHSGGGPQRLPAVTSSLAGTVESQAKSQAQFPVRPPEGFHRQP